MANTNDAFEGGPVSPRGSGISNGDSGGTTGGIVDPSSIGGTVDVDDGDDNYARNVDGSVKRNRDGSPRKRRGRKPGTAKATRPNDLKASIDALTSMIGIAHSAVAAVAATPELELNMDEAKLLATATVPVLDMVDFAPDPRFIAIFGLIGAAAQVYAPRAVMIRMRKASERANRAKPINPSPNGFDPNGSVAAAYFDASKAN